MSLIALFGIVAGYGVISLLVLFEMYEKLVLRGLRGPELMIPFLMGLLFTSAIGILLIWQLSRMINTFGKSSQNVVVEKRFIREQPAAQLNAPFEPGIASAGRPSVVEHTTRHFTPPYSEPGQTRES